MPVGNTLVIPYRKRLRSPEKDGEVLSAETSKRPRSLHYQGHKDNTENHDFPRGPSASHLGTLPISKARQQLLDSLIVEKSNACDDVIRAPALGTCAWLLDHTAYLQWRDPIHYPQHHGLFWINGMSGTGKSTTLKFVYQQLKRNAESTSDLVIHYFPGANKSAMDNSLFGVYQSLLLHILNHFTDLQVVLDDIDLVSQDNDDRVIWDVETLQNTLSAALNKLGKRKLTCFVDTLGECQQSEVQHMADFFTALGEMAALNGTQVYFCFASHSWGDFHSKGQILTLHEQEEHAQDIERFIQQKLQIGTGERVELIHSQLQQRSKGVFLWAALVIPTLNQEFSGWDLLAVEQKLADLPSALSELLPNILKQHKKNREKLLLCLQWLLFTKRPLHVVEFYLAITSGLNSPANGLPWVLRQHIGVQLQEFVLETSCGLAEVTETGNVVLVHELIRSFLLNRGGACLLWPHIANFESHAHNSLKECCIRYMDAQMLNAKFLPYGKAKFYRDNALYIRRRALAEFPFVTYACQNILHHADAAAESISQEGFLNSFDLEGWIKIHNFLESDKRCHYTLGANILYILAEHNYARLIKTHLASDSRISLQGQRYNYPLFAALINGNIAAVRELLRRPMLLLGHTDIPANLPIKHDFVTPDDLAPLQWAVKKAVAPLIMLLIASGEFDDNLVDHCNQPLVVWAAMHGHKSIVKMLIETKYVDVNTRDNYGNTPLSQAVNHKNTGIVSYLLSRSGINVNTQDEAKYSPLLLAAINGHEGIMDHLLAMESAAVNVLNYMGETPLMCAVQRGHMGIAARLLATGNVDVNLKDQCGRTALSLAVEYERQDMVKALVAMPGIDVNTRNRLGVPPIFEALRRGNLAIADLIRPLL